MLRLIIIFYLDQLALEQPEINFKMKIRNVLIAGLNDQNEKPSAGSGERYDISDKNILLKSRASVEREGGRRDITNFKEMKFLATIWV